MNKCPNCNSEATHFIYKLENVVTYQNVLVGNLAEANSVPRANMDFYYCDDCSFLYNKSFDGGKVGYGDEYENDQSCSPRFMEHINNMSKRIINGLGVRSHKILEIGCGNGYFLKKIVCDDNNNYAVGYDKSIQQDFFSERLSVYKKYYDMTDSGGFDVVLSRHVVEHIINNNELMGILRKKNPDARFIIETPCLEWIVENNTFFDIFYEHCSYFSERSLGTLFARHDLHIETSSKVFGGQYLWIEAAPKSSDRAQNISSSLSVKLVKEFFERFAEMIRSYKVNIMNNTGKVAVWGAGAKGVTFVNLIDPNKEFIDCVIDINPRKHGKYVPGTGHPIESQDILHAENFSTLIIMNSNYYNEICEFVAGRNISVKVL